MSTTSTFNPKCHRCGKLLDFSPKDKVGRRDYCPSCGSSLHCCYMCIYYDPKSYNECRESSADRVLDKEKDNFCDYFSLNGALKENLANKEQNVDFKRKLDDLFKKD